MSWVDLTRVERSREEGSDIFRLTGRSPGVVRPWAVGKCNRKEKLPARSDVTAGLCVYLQELPNLSRCLSNRHVSRDGRALLSVAGLVRATGCFYLLGYWNNECKIVVEWA